MAITQPPSGYCSAFVGDDIQGDSCIYVGV